MWHLGGPKFFGLTYHTLSYLLSMVITQSLGNPALYSTGRNQAVQLEDNWLAHDFLKRSQQ
jgi:hypothetical protein